VSPAGFGRRFAALCVAREDLSAIRHRTCGPEHWEAGPQLLLQAFLQRVINAGGQIEREYGLGRRRTDLLVIFDRDPARPWPEKIYRRIEGWRGRTITVWGM